MGSAAVRMTRKGSIHTLLVLLFCLVPPTPARNLHHEKLTIGNVELLRPYLTGDAARSAYYSCVLCNLQLTEFGCNEIIPENKEQCRRDVCPRCSYWSHCLPEWCPPRTTTPPTTSTTNTIPTTPTTSPTPSISSVTLPPKMTTSPEPADAPNSNTSTKASFIMSK